MTFYNRVRNRGSISSVKTITSSNNAVPCIGISAGNVVYNVARLFGETSSMMDVTNGDWKRRVGRSRNDNTFVFHDMYKITYRVIASGSSSMRFTNTSMYCSPPQQRWEQLDGSLLAYWTSSDANQDVVEIVKIEDLVAEVWTSCLAKRGEGRANYLESLAELDKAFRMVATPLENLTSLIKSLRGSGKRMKGYERVAAGSKAHIRFVSAEWLRFRYGVMPIISDVKAALAALERGHSSKPELFTAKSSGSGSGRRTSSGLIPSTSFELNYLKVTYEYREVRAYYHERYIKSFWNDLGFNFRNLLGLPWELTRYSFVVDWFGNVGDLIYANIPRVNVQDIGGQVVVKTEKKTYWLPSTLVNKTPLSWTITGGVSDTVEISSSEYNRYTPTFTSKLVIKNDFKLDQWVRASDAAAVLVQWLGSISFDRH